MLWLKARCRARWRDIPVEEERGDDEEARQATERNMMMSDIVEFSESAMSDAPRRCQRARCYAYTSANY